MRRPPLDHAVARLAPRHSVPGGLECGGHRCPRRCESTAPSTNPSRALSLDEGDECGGARLASSARFGHREDLRGNVVVTGTAQCLREPDGESDELDRQIRRGSTSCFQSLTIDERVRSNGSGRPCARARPRPGRRPRGSAARARPSCSGRRGCGRDDGLRQIRELRDGADSDPQIEVFGGKKGRSIAPDGVERLTAQHHGGVHERRRRGKGSPDLGVGGRVTDLRELATVLVDESHCTPYQTDTRVAHPERELELEPARQATSSASSRAITGHRA